MCCLLLSTLRPCQCCCMHPFLLCAAALDVCHCNSLIHSLHSATVRLKASYTQLLTSICESLDRTAKAVRPSAQQPVVLSHDCMLSCFISGASALESKERFWFENYISTAWQFYHPLLLITCLLTGVPSITIISALPTITSSRAAALHKHALPDAVWH